MTILGPTKPPIRQLFAIAATLISCTVVSAGFAGVSGSNAVAAQASSEAATVAVGRVAEVRLADSQSFVGTLQPLRKSTLGSAVDGRVVSIDLMPGDSVSADQSVAQLRTGTLEIELRTAEIALKTSRQSLQEMETSLPKEMELARANVRETKARLQYSKTEYDRSQRLRGSSGAISQGELELSRSLYLADQEAASSARIEFEKLTLTKDVRLMQSQLSVEAAQQEVKRLLDLKQKYTIRAPFEGVITEKLTEVGEWITQGQPIAEVLQLNPIVLVVNAPQEQLQAIQNSMILATEEKPLLATIQVEGVASPIEGVVKSIVSQADLRSRTFPVRIEIENQGVGSGYVLQPGMLGRATLLVGPKTDMLMVKKDALVLGGRVPRVFKILSQNGTDTAVEVQVKTGAALDEWIQVTGELSTTDRVVLLGNERLRDGQEVRVARTIEDLP